MLKNTLQLRLEGVKVNNQIVTLLKNGGVGVIPTDTIYGIVGSALNPETVEKIYDLRKRSTDKPFIILISSLDDLKKFDVKLTDKQNNFLKKIWPNPVSIILSCPGEKWRYLHKGTKTLAFRIPSNKWLLKLLKDVGPLVAPSANWEEEKPSENIEEAKKYFGDSIFYVDSGEIISKPSMLVAINGNSVKILREGEPSFSSKIKQVMQKLGFEFDQI